MELLLDYYLSTTRLLRRRVVSLKPGEILDMDPRGLSSAGTESVSTEKIFVRIFFRLRELVVVAAALKVE